MDILAQCQSWHENKEYGRIIEALEAIPRAERTPEQASELARAYNNAGAAKASISEGRALLRRAIELLQPHEEYFDGDYSWNFRMGYAYFYLDQEGRALPYFEQALAARPEDEDTKYFIEQCNRYVMLPTFRQSFRERTAAAWAAFAASEGELRRMLDEDKERRRGGELMAKCSESLELAMPYVACEIGFNGEKYELILIPEGDKVRLFELVYFQRHAPAEVLEKWNVLVGRQPMQGVGLRDGECEVSDQEVLFWLEKQERGVGLTLYCEKLAPELAAEATKNKVWWRLTTLADMVLGEIAGMAHIEWFDVVAEPLAGEGRPLVELPEALRELGLELDIDPGAYLERYTGYQMEPNEDPDADWRQDVIVGSTSCLPLVNAYLRGEDRLVDNLHEDCVAAGFFCYPLGSLADKESSQRIFDFRDALEEALEQNAGPEAVTLIGGATGVYCGYVDFIAWDLPAVLEAGKAFFAASGLPWASFHSFRRNCATYYLWDKEKRF